MAADTPYAKVVWTANDVLTLAPHLTEDEAEQFLYDVEGQVQDRTIEHGWEVLETLLGMEGLMKDEEAAELNP